MGKVRKSDSEQTDKPGSSNPASFSVQDGSSSNGNISKRKQKVSNYEKAKQVYEQIQEEKRQRKAQERIDREKRQEAIQEYNGTKKKMNKAIKKKNRKGQPNLGAQVEVLLEKMQKKIEKNEF